MRYDSFIMSSEARRTCSSGSTCVNLSVSSTRKSDVTSEPKHDTMYAAVRSLSFGSELNAHLLARGGGSALGGVDRDVFSLDVLGREPPDRPLLRRVFRGGGPGRGSGERSREVVLADRGGPSLPHVPGYTSYRPAQQKWSPGPFVLPLTHNSFFPFRGEGIIAALLYVSLISN